MLEMVYFVYICCVFLGIREYTQEYTSNMVQNTATYGILQNIVWNII